MIITKEITEVKKYEVRNISYNPDLMEFCIELTDEKGNAITATENAGAVINSFFEKEEDREGAGMFLEHIAKHLANIATGG
jgi:hypothetical protein